LRYAGTGPHRRPERVRDGWPWAAAGAVLGMLAALAWQFPAAWATPLVEQATAGRLLLGQPRGTVWNGSAVLMLAGGPGSRDRTALPGRLSWRLGLSLHAGAGDAGGKRRTGLGDAGLQATLTHDCCLEKPATLRLSPFEGGALRIENLDWRAPAGLAAGLGAPWNTLDFTGHLRLTAQAMQWRRQAGRMAMQGEALLQVDELCSRLAALRPIGSYRVALAGPAPGDVGQLRIELSTVAGALQLQGRGEWVGGELRFRGEAQAMAPYQAELANVLNLIGNRTGPVTLRIRR
jgi:general secretion pathway protein N